MEEELILFLELKAATYNFKEKKQSLLLSV